MLELGSDIALETFGFLLQKGGGIVENDVSAERFVRYPDKRFWSWKMEFHREIRIMSKWC